LLIRVLYRSALYFAKMEVNCHHLAERLAQQRPALFMESVGARAPCVGELCRTVSRWRVGMPPRWGRWRIDGRMDRGLAFQPRAHAQALGWRERIRKLDPPGHALVDAAPGAGLLS